MKDKLWGDLVEAQGGCKTAAAPELSYALKGRLILSASGWILLDVPNALGYGAFQALNEPGTEVPLQDSGQYRAHISVMRPEDLEEIGGAAKITERGKSLGYTLGPVRSVAPAGWDGVSRVWMIEVHSPELEKLRKSYGLSALPKDGEFKFHITFAIRKVRVLQAGNVKKSSLIHSPGWFLSTDRFHEKAGSGFYDTSIDTNDQAEDTQLDPGEHSVLSAICNWQNYQNPAGGVGGAGADFAPRQKEGAVSGRTHVAGGGGRVYPNTKTANLDSATATRGRAVDRLAERVQDEGDRVRGDVVGTNTATGRVAARERRTVPVYAAVSAAVTRRSNTRDAGRADGGRGSGRTSGHAVLPACDRRRGARESLATTGSGPLVKQSQSSFYVDAIGQTPINYNRQQGFMQNLLSHAAAIKARGDRSIAEASSFDRLQNAMDPNRGMQRLRSYLAGQRQPLVSSPLDRFIQGE